MTTPPIEDTGQESESTIGWGRAVLTSAVIVVLGAVCFIYGPNWALTHLSGLSRNGRVAVATIGFAVLFVLFAWGLRRLQARRVI